MYRVRMYANAIQVSKCLQSQCIILYGNILYQETAVCAVCHCIDIESMIYMHWVHQTVWSGEMTIIRANCPVQSIINNLMMVHTCINSTVVWLWCLYLTITQLYNYTMNLYCLWADGQWGTAELTIAHRQWLWVF